MRAANTIALLAFLSSTVAASRKLLDLEPGYTVAVIRNPDDKVVRIYGRYPLSQLGEPNKVTCRFENQKTDESESESIPSAELPAKVELLKDYKDHAEEVLRGMGDFYLECNVAGETWPRSKLSEDENQWRVIGQAWVNGSPLGKAMAVQETATHAGGHIAICSSPILHNQKELKEWIDYHLDVGIGTFIMHVPDLTPRSRAKWRRARGIHSKSSEEDVAGVSPVEEITFPHESSNINVAWQHYDWPFVAIDGDDLVLSSCMYRLRHMADYVIQLDTTEYIYIRNHTETFRPYKLRSLLDQYLPQHTPALELTQEMYPQECQSQIVGDYPSLFTLTAGETGAKRYIVRPNAVEWTTLTHGPTKGAGDWGEVSDKKIQLSKDTLFVKRVAPGEIGTAGREEVCMVGVEATLRGLPVLQIGI